MRTGLLRRHAERHRERSTRRIDLPGLQVRQPEVVVQLDVVARPRARRLEVGHGFRQPPRRIQRQPEHLLGLPPLEGAGLEPRDERHQRLDGFRVIVGVVLREPAKVGHERFCRVELRQPLLCLGGAAGLNQLTNRGDIRGSGVPRFLGSGVMGFQGSGVPGFGDGRLGPDRNTQRHERRGDERATSGRSPHHPSPRPASRSS